MSRHFCEISRKLFVSADGLLELNCLSKFHVVSVCSMSIKSVGVRVYVIRNVARVLNPQRVSEEKRGSGPPEIASGELADRDKSS